MPFACVIITIFGNFAYFLLNLNYLNTQHYLGFLTHLFPVELRVLMLIFMNKYHDMLGQYSVVLNHSNRYLLIHSQHKLCQKSSKMYVKQ